VKPCNTSVEKSGYQIPDAKPIGFVAIGILNTFGVVGCRLLNHTYMVW
jgi:hypothetical protein